MAILEPLIHYFSPPKIQALAVGRFCIIAEDQINRIIGTASLELEAEARRLGVKMLTVDSSVTGATFYEAQGFHRTGRVFVRSAGTQINMEKKLFQ